MKIKNILFFSAITLLAISPNAFAIELDAAKAQGLVGETPSGYLAAVKPPSGEVKQLIDKINSERKAHYQSIANKNNTPVAAVEGLAGKKAIDMTPKGQYIQNESGQWQTK